MKRRGEPVKKFLVAVVASRTNESSERRKCLPPLHFPSLSEPIPLHAPLVISLIQVFLRAKPVSERPISCTRIAHNFILSYIQEQNRLWPCRCLETSNFKLCSMQAMGTAILQRVLCCRSSSTAMRTLQQEAIKHALIHRSCPRCSHNSSSKTSF